MTIVVDTSALVAVIFGEDDAQEYADALVRAAGTIHLSAATLVEATMVVTGRQGDEAAADLAAMVRDLAITVEAVDPEQADSAIRAWRQYGKGRHPAGLNFGDCFSYALAARLGAPLLFKGDDFSQTDIPSVLPLA